MKKESGVYAKKSAEFKRWLALYFIEKGNWKLTDKAIEEFGTDATPRQTMEFAEHYTSKEREERTQYRVGLTAKEKKRVAHIKVADMIDEGKTEELYDKGYVTYSADWKNKENHVAAVRKLVEILDMDPRDILKEDLDKNKLRALRVYYDFICDIIKEAFPELDIKPWEMETAPHGFYEKKKNRIAAVKWLIEKLKKDPRDLTRKDFNSNRLGGLFTEHYNGSPYDAVKEAFPEMDIKPWEMVVTPRGIFDNKENRIAAVKWLVRKLKKDPRDLTAEDFNSNRLAGLLSEHHNGSPYDAVKEAGLVRKTDEKQMRNRGGFGYRVAPSSKEVLEAARKLARNAEKKLPKRMVKGRRTPRTG